ncbi:MAG: hypothetical protein M0Z40_14620 [Actinomycetota bacterium]|nr:hypothetical protein [Actinomycetota bacterium]MDA8076439.1 hypothetical protein [Actinomycetota bacterium]
MATPIGTFTNSTKRQLSAEVSTPPRTRPDELATPPITLQMASALCRAPGSVWLAVIRLELEGASSAAPTPSMIRAPSSICPFTAKPPARLAAVKTPRPTRNTRRLPNRSLARAPASKRPPSATR